MKRTARASILLLLPLWASVALSELVQIGWVEAVNAEKGSYSLTRSSKPVAVSVLTPLLSGDKISVAGKTGSLLLQLGGSVVEVTAVNSPYEVSVLEEASLLDTVVGKIAFVLDGGRSERRTVSAVSRGKSLSVPALAVPGAQVMRRQLYNLQWLGGQLPCEVYVSEPEEEETLFKALASERAITLRNTHQWPDVIAIDIHCKSEQAGYYVKLIDSECLPGKELRETDLRDGAAIYAYWLYTADGGVWAWEAQQRLYHGAVEGDALSVTLLDKLRDER